MWAPEPECVEEVLEEYKVVLLFASVLSMSTVGILVGLFVANDSEVALVGIFIGLIVGFTGWLIFGSILLGWTKENIENDFSEREVRGEELVERYKEYPRCGSYIVTTFCDLYSPEGTDNIRVVLDMPSQKCEIEYDFPYDWDESSSGIVEVLKSRGIDQYEFHELAGEPVLVKTVDGSSTEFDVYNVRKPSERIRDLHKADELDRKDVDVEEIREQFDIDLPWSISDDSENVDDSEITAKEGSVYSVVDSVR